MEYEKIFLEQRRCLRAHGIWKVDLLKSLWIFSFLLSVLFSNFYLLLFFLIRVKKKKKNGSLMGCQVIGFWWVRKIRPTIDRLLDRPGLSVWLGLGGLFATRGLVVSLFSLVKNKKKQSSPNTALDHYIL